VVFKKSSVCVCVRSVRLRVRVVVFDEALCFSKSETGLRIALQQQTVPHRRFGVVDTVAVV
jgi:hypothetical protein